MVEKDELAEVCEVEEAVVVEVGGFVVCCVEGEELADIGEVEEAVIGEVCEAFGRG